MSTLKEISKKIGISISAISQVLNNTPNSRISKKTTKKILKVVRELNYTPHYVARQLRLKKTDMIGVIVPDISTPFYSDIIKGIENTVTESGYLVNVCNSDDNLDKERKILSVLKNRKVDGLIVVPANGKDNKDIYRSLLKEKFSFVFIDRYIPAIKTDYVVTDNFFGAYELTKRLIEKGHRIIGYLGEYKRDNVAHDRFSGYKKAIKENNIPFKNGLVRNPSSAEKGLYKGMKELLLASSTAVFLGSNTYIFEVVKAIKESGLRINKDIDITGFDEPYLPLKAIKALKIDKLDFSITCAIQPRYEIGNQAAKILVKKIEGEKKDIKGIFLRPKLITI